MSSSRNIRLSPSAQSDLRSIIRYTRDAWGEEQELAYTKALFEALKRIEAFPSIGKLRPDIGPEMRALVAEQHLVLYRVGDIQVEVIRIVHARMSVDEE